LRDLQNILISLSGPQSTLIIFRQRYLFNRISMSRKLQAREVKSPTKVTRAIKSPLQTSPYSLNALPVEMVLVGSSTQR
jgi:hypothetical protein